MVGSSTTDAQRQLIWLSRQVAPVVKRLAGVYGMDAVLEIVSSKGDPSAVALIRREADELLADYDDWSIDRAEELI